jgi:hypothetical protein
MKAWSPSDALEAGFEAYMKEQEEKGALDDEEDEETAEHDDAAGVFEPLPGNHVERTLQPCVRSHAAQVHPVARCRSTCRSLSRRLRCPWCTGLGVAPPETGRRCQIWLSHRSL